MNEIKVGDLVVVVRGMGCCGKPTGNEGKIFQVSRFENSGCTCVYCGFSPMPTSAWGLQGALSITLDRLRRIPPLSELESTEHKEEQPA